jgi:hypothetical protein
VVGIARVIADRHCCSTRPSADGVSCVRPEGVTVINRIDGDPEACLQVAFILDSLDNAGEAEDGVAGSEDHSAS